MCTDILKECGIKVAGYTFDEEMSNFYSYLHNFKDRSQKYEVCICSNILGDSFVERLSTGFRRDLTLVLESAGVKGVKLVLSDDSRFIDTVISSHTVRKVFKKCARDILGMYPFPLHIKGVGDIVDFK